jgi:hypothetical protein
MRDMLKLGYLIILVVLLSSSCSSVSSWNGDQFRTVPSDTGFDGLEESDLGGEYRPNPTRMGFIANHGQFNDADVKFYAPQASGGIAFKDSEVLFNYEDLGTQQERISDPMDLFDREWMMPSGAENPSPQRRGCTIGLSFPGSNICSPNGIDPLPGYSNYLIGDDPSGWAVRVNTFSKIVFKNLYDGIDLFYMITPEGVKYEFILAPGAEHKDIRINVRGHDGLFTLDGQELVILTASGEVHDSGLLSYYAGDEDASIGSAFQILDGETYGFDLQYYDDRRSVVIDPLMYSSYIGGSGEEVEHGYYDVVMDDDGFIYLGGSTESVDFPTTPGAYSTNYHGSRDVYVMKFTPNGTVPIYSTYIGGVRRDQGGDVFVDSSGRVGVSGGTDSIDFPMTDNALDDKWGGGPMDGFVTVINETGTGLHYSTYFGSDDIDYIEDAIGGPDGSIYLTGVSTSLGLNITPGAFQTVNAGDGDIFVTKINSSGRTLDFSTFIGGSATESGWSLLLDVDGSLLVSGYTYSSDFNVTPGAFDTVYYQGDGSDAFILRLTADGSDLGFSTYIGGDMTDYISDLEWGPDGSFYSIGWSNSSWIPTTPGAYQRNREASRETMVYHFDEDGSTLLNGTLFGSYGTRTTIVASELSVTDDHRLMFTGYTDNGVLPVTDHCAQGKYEGSVDGFVVVMNSNLSKVLYCSYHGGSSLDVISGSVNIGNNSLWVAGFSRSTDFTTTEDAYQRSSNGMNEAFLSRFLVEVRFPTAEAGSDVVIDQHQKVRFNGTGSSDEVEIFNWTWTFEHEGVIVELYGPTPEFMFTEVGIHEVTLRVFNDLGLNATDTMSVTVLDVTPPEVDAGEDISVPQHTLVTLNGSRSKDNVGITRWEWNFTYAGEPVTLLGMSHTYMFDNAGTYIITLRASDVRDNWGSGWVNVTVQDTSDPVAMIPPIPVIDQHETVTFDGSISTDNVGIVNWTWSFTYDGKVIELYGIRPTFKFYMIGSYTITLTVRDGGDNEDVDSILVIVNDITPPIADAGLDIMMKLPGYVQFDGGASSDNDGIASYRWSFEYAGREIQLDGVQPTYLFDLPGTFDVTLKVTDIGGLWSTDVVRVTVPDVIEPEADAGADIIIDQAVRARFSGRDSHDDTEIVNWTWTFEYVDGPVTLFGEAPSFVFDEAGVFVVTLVVLDPSNNRDIDEVTVTVIDITPPVPNPGNDIVVDQGMNVTLDGSGSIDNVGIVKWTWSITLGGEPIGKALVGEVDDLVVDEPGVYVVTLRVTDEAGNSATAALDLIVRDTISPVPLTKGKITVKAGDTFTLDASGSTDNVAIVEWTWSFKEGGKTVELEGVSVDYSFDEAGEYEVTLTIVDAEGNLAYENITVIVEGVSMLWMAVGLGIVIAVIVFFLLIRTRGKTAAEGTDREG